MGFRFQKRISLFKGVSLNLSKSGMSWTVGRRGASVNFRGDKVTGNVGIPGTGLSYRQSMEKPNAQQGQGPRGGVAGVLFWLVLAAVVGYVLLR